VLEVQEIELLGSEGEPMFGHPTLAVKHPSIKDWISDKEVPDQRFDWNNFPKNLNLLAMIQSITKYEQFGQRTIRYQ
jgi:hypothetical protein